MRAENYQNPLPGIPDCESPLFDKLYEGREHHPYFSIAKSLRDQGFAVVDFPDAHLSERIERIKTEFSRQFDLPGYHQGRDVGDLRVQDAWESNADVKALAANAEIIDILEFCYGRRTFPFQTLNFPVGTQQHYHSDMVHFSSTPERFMAGVWLAMEDTDAENGSLIYYPGSHRLPFVSNAMVGENWGGAFRGQHAYHAAWQALIDAHGLKPQVFHAKKGQALIWSANLLHGGSAVRDRARTRWSQVSHYYFEDCTYYQPMKTDFELGRAMVLNPRDIRSGELVEHRYLGEAVARDYLKMLRENTAFSNRGESMRFFSREKPVKRSWLRKLFRKLRISR